jgi:Sulfotransferase family
MIDITASRIDQWTPAPRPEWLTRFNREGQYLDLDAVVPLDENSLLADARSRTGLSDFGPEDWHEPFQILLKSLREESRLNLMGRLTTRQDLVFMLEARLRIEETYRRHPEIHDEVITEPFFIIGQGRSGTSFLLNLLNEIPENGAPKTWEAMFPCPPPEKATYETDSRAKRARELTDQFARMVPEHGSMYEFAGDMPTENAQLHCLLFQAPAWFTFFQGQVPGYSEYMSGKPVVPIYQYEKKILKLLQWKNPRRHWLLKSPICIMHIPEILEVYPDARFIWPHRDPIKALASTVNLSGTMFWSKSDEPFLGNTNKVFTDPTLSAAMMSKPIDWLESGVLTPERLCSIRYCDLAADPVATVRSIYDYFSVPFGDEAENALKNYIAENPRSRRPVHHYSAGERERISKERKFYARYQAYFHVANEL